MQGKLPVRVDEVPLEILNVPVYNRQYLSPIHLACSLGRAENANPFTNYRILKGTMGLTKNLRSLVVYSGLLGAFLHKYEDAKEWYHPSLDAAANWLSLNNDYLKAYKSLIFNQNEPYRDNVFPVAKYESLDESEQSRPPIHGNEIIISNYDFDSEIHNEDNNSKRLLAGFVTLKNSVKLPIKASEPCIEALIFPDLFPYGRYHYKCLSSDDGTYNGTYGKYIKKRLFCPDSRFRIHTYWPSWSYLELEKKRNFQNANRHLRQKNADCNFAPPTAAEIICRSVYTGKHILDEEKTSTLPSFIRTGSSYFHGRGLHLNAMITTLGKPSIFYTLTMAESRWIHLQEILRKTDNHDDIPTNRPFHCVLHYLHRLRSVRKYLWKKELSGWLNLLDWFERVEFQCRGAAHTHGLMWVEESIENMISKNVIRADMPDPMSEPELYKLVKEYQVHTCRPLDCGGPAAPGEICQKGFPRPFSDRTYEDIDGYHFIYKCTKDEDRYIVPYHEATLFLWQGHLNFQYVVNRGIARYVVKYMIKDEPSDNFIVKDIDSFQQHVQARRMSSMEIMFLLLEEKICDSTRTVIFLPTTSPAMRRKAVIPIYLINEENSEYPYWDDLIDKYFARPHEEQFEKLTYAEYFQQYSLQRNRSKGDIRPIDLLGNMVIKRKKPCLTRYRYLRLEDGEAYFYHQLLLSKPWRSENEISGSFSSYREHFRILYPDAFKKAISFADQETAVNTIHIQDAYIRIIDAIITGISNQSVCNIIRLQLDALKPLPKKLPSNIMATLPPDQYMALTYIRTYLGPESKRKWPNFFLTGPAGTGKTFMLKAIIASLEQCNEKCLLMASTGVAAQNVGGKTIHSELKIRFTEYGFTTLIFFDENEMERIKKYTAICIEEISMVSSKLFEFVSSIFSRLHNDPRPFGGINVIVVGDLAQLSPVSGQPVYKSNLWHRFYPLFLTTPHRQDQDPMFYNLLQHIRMGNITDEVWEKLQQKHSECLINQNNVPIASLNTTHIVGFRETAAELNKTICEIIYTAVCHDESTEEVQYKCINSTAIDYLNGVEQELTETEKAFKSFTNLPGFVQLQPGARVMFLNNDNFDDGICNGSIGIITELCEDLRVRVAFFTAKGIVDFIVGRKTDFFTFQGAHASRTQYPLQNAFALTVHKTQGVTLQFVTVSLNDEIFTVGQAYVAISRATSWASLCISHLSRNAFKVDKGMLYEYERLVRMAKQGLPI